MRDQGLYDPKIVTRPKDCRAENAQPCRAPEGWSVTGGTYQESEITMTSKVTTTCALLTAVLTLGFSSASMADEATASVNVRTGPGTQYRVVDTLYPGETVNIETCRSNGWCRIEHSGPDGWVSARYLSNDGRDYGADRDREVRRSPDVSFSFSFGRGDGFSVGTPPRGGSRDLVCLVTFFNRGDVAGGADADVQRARVMSRAEAERRDRPNDRQAIFDYGTNAQTRETCNYLDRLN